MNCPQCGATIPDGTLFCTSCGTALPSGPAAESATPQSPTNAQEYRVGAPATPAGGFTVGAPSTPAGTNAPAATAPMPPSDNASGYAQTASQPAGQAAWSQPQASSPYAVNPGNQPPQAPMGVPGGPASASKGLAIAALVCGIIALLAAITVFGGFFFGLVAIVLGIVAVVKARKGTAGGFGLGVGGIVCGALGLLISIAITATGVALMGDVMNNPEKYGISDSDITEMQNALNGDAGTDNAKENNSSSTPSKDSAAQSNESSSSSSPAPKSGSPNAVPAPYSDGKGSLTVAAALNEDGATIASQLDALGLSFDSTYGGWRNQEFTICFDVMDENSDWITPEKLKTLGAGAASGYMITSDSHETVAKAWEALNQTEVVKSNIGQSPDGMETSYAVVKSKSGKSAIVTLMSMDTTVVLMVYPDTQKEFGTDPETLYDQLTA